MRAIALRSALATALAGPAIAVAPLQADAAPSCSAVPSPTDEASITAMTNASRTSHGLARLRRDDAIGDAARRWSLRMARTGNFAHSALGWARGRTAGENIAYAATARAAYGAMLASPPHRRNLLGGAWRFVGVGAARCDGTLFVTVHLMAPPSIRP